MPTYDEKIKEPVQALYDWSSENFAPDDGPFLLFCDLTGISTTLYGGDLHYGRYFEFGTYDLGLLANALDAFSRAPTVVAAFCEELLNGENE